MKGTLIYQFNGITITEYCGVYTVSDGKETVAVNDLPAFDVDFLKSLLKDKATVRELAATAKTAKTAKLFRPGYFSSYDFESGGGVAGKELAKWMEKEAQLREYDAQGY